MFLSISVENYINCIKAYIKIAEVVH
jgi:hypothetical protein